MSPITAESQDAPSPVFVTGDGAICIEAPEPVLSELHAWLPAGLSGPEAGLPSSPVGGGLSRGERWPRRPSRRGLVRIVFGAPPLFPDTDPMFAMRHAAAWRGSSLSDVTLCGNHGCGGTIDLVQLEATLTLPSFEAARDLPDLLTVCVGMLSGGVDRALVHGGGVVGPDGRVWVVAGPSGSGKSTTIANLIRAGWDYLCDDRLFLLCGDAAEDSTEDSTGDPIGDPIHAPATVEVEGWLRPFLLDPLSARGEIATEETGPRRTAPGKSSPGDRPRSDRVPVDPAALGPGKARSHGTLGGILYPAIVASGRTSLAPLQAPESMRRLIRESPWILADTEGSSAGFALLGRTAVAPAFELRLAADTRSNPALLSQIVGDVLSGVAVPPAGEGETSVDFGCPRTSATGS